MYLIKKMRLIVVNKHIVSLTYKLGEVWKKIGSQ
jgi:hypothetical protein